MKPDYTTAREIFQLFKARITTEDAEVASQLQAAVVMLRLAYDTAIYENRFVVGGAIEHLVAAAFNGARMPAVHLGRADTRMDVRVQVDGKNSGFSTKASFSGFSTRLINTIGETIPEWLEPTLFLFDGVGIVYADPVLLPDATIHKKDALVLDGKKMKAYIKSHPEYIIPLDFLPPEGGTSTSSRTASEEVARSIIGNFPRLSLP